MSANGQLDPSELAPIVGSSPRPGGRPLLRRDAAAAYNALHAESMRRFGISMGLDEGTTRRAYRELDAQYEAKRIYGSNAATPGTSNHGWGINVDLQTRQQRWVIDQIGAAYGFSKAWSDASWEWWHITFNASYVTADVTPFVVLKLGSRGKRVRYLQFLLRRQGLKAPAKGSSGYGYFGKGTRSAVIEFQKRKDGLGADGVVGPNTWEALRKSSRKRPRKHNSKGKN